MHSFTRRIKPRVYLDVTNTGNGERGTGNGERGTGNGERGTGNGERRTGNGEPGTGNRERESGNECTAVTRLIIQNGGGRKRRKEVSRL